MGKEKIPSIYDWMGGAKAIDKLITTFYEMTLTDRLLRPFFERMPPEHIHNVALWFGEIFGGPKAYSQKFGKATAHPHVMEQHLNLHINEEQRKRWVDLMIQAADKVGLPTDPEFRSAFVAYLEWGTRIAQIVSQPGTTLPKEDDMPTWGWGEKSPQPPLP